MGSLYKSVKSLKVLHNAWRKVATNGRSSVSKETRNEIAKFGEDEFVNLRRIQRLLGKGIFEFEKQRGLAIEKETKGKLRPLVIAPVANRIVQRAILDVLVLKVKTIKQVMSTLTSIGGIPGRGTRHALALVCNAIDRHARYFLRSDIRGFFTKIPRGKVVKFVGDSVSDIQFLNLFESALRTELINLDELGEHRSLFPIGDNGVAQGSALSTLAGNVVLQDFDRRFNDRGILCIRYVDDFILLGPNESSVRAAFQSALKFLEALGMSAYSPWDNGEKAECGEVRGGFTFLGCDVFANGRLIQPSRRARRHLRSLVSETINKGIEGMRDASATAYCSGSQQGYAQTLNRLNGIVSGWGHAFRFCSAPQVMVSLDATIDKEIKRFFSQGKAFLSSANAQQRRRLLGVRLLSDVPVSRDVIPWVHNSADTN